MDKLLLIFFIPVVISDSLLDNWDGPGPRLTYPGPIKFLNQGMLRGRIEHYDLTESIVSYKGIPYAQPPVRELRWKPPVPASGWKGIKDASLFGANCPQFGAPLIGTRQPFVMNEDCLFINIFTPNRMFMRNLPVYFHIHLGGFHGESGDPNIHSWEFFPQNGVIYVTFNYRLDVLGQLNTQDRHATGNYGLKDILEALKWVNRNIHSFGGDPNNVILMGFSVGGVVVQALIYSEDAKGLFAKAVSLSGSLFQTYPFQPNPKEKAEALGRMLNIEFNNTEELVAQLRTFTPEQLSNATIRFLPTEMPTLFVPRTFVPSIDAEDTDEIKLIPKHPDVLARTANYNKVPLMIGFNSMDSMTNLLFPNGRDRFNADPHMLIPDAWKIERNSSEAWEIIDGFRRVYFNGSEIVTEDMMMQWMEFCSDRENAFGMSKFVDFHYKEQPVYYYRFSYSGAFSFSQQYFGLMHVNGTTSFDDYMYLHRMNRFRNPVPRSDHAYTVQDRYLRLMLNFGRFNNPTPNSQDRLLQNIQWPQVTDNLEFLDIGENLVVGTHPFKERMDLWRDFDRRFNKF
ncbi:unnamed protein product [Chironomus riparius]|uniref:Carboxylesterase type B domain-containing protein n=1 Tax=Chironomus riparius TaxID=315576 RepID=A0A9N9RJX8_9DIPT|nr:unnamed protein product [Chironomus riparius]